MKEEAKYKVEGHYLTLTEYREYVFEHAKQFPDKKLRDDYIKGFDKIFDGEMKESWSKHKMQTIILPLIGLGGLIGIVFLVLINPFPSIFQSGVFWVILSLLSAAFASMIPGFVEFKYQGLIRAGGGIAIFLIMYFYVPTVMKTKLSDSQQSKMMVYVARKDTSNIQAIPVNFDRNNSKKLCEFTNNELLKYYGNNPSSPDTFTYFRKTDGMIYSTEKCSSINELEMIAISNPVLRFYPNKRDAYLHFFSLLK